MNLMSLLQSAFGQSPQGGGGGIMGGTPQETPDPLAPDPGPQASIGRQQAPMQQGGSANPGLYGLLPERFQHGTLRNALGALGDAFLVQSGNQAKYGPRMERQQIGQAFDGFDPNNAQASQQALSRIAQTGSPQSLEMVDKLQQSLDTTMVRKQIADQNNIYRQQGLDVKNDSAMARMTPLVGGLVANANDPASYKSAYDRAEIIAQRIDPKFHAADFGLVEPEKWTPAATANVGMTANNVTNSADKAKQRATSERNTDVTAGARIKSAGISAGAHVTGARISADKPTEATMESGIIAKQNRGDELTPAEATWWKNRTTKGKGGGRSLPGGITSPPSGGAPVKVNTPADAAKLPKGTHYVTPDGRQLIR